MELAPSTRSNSPLNKLYSTEEFRASWHSDVSRMVAVNALHLRRFRELSQTELASEMGTSQSAVARIEGGDENITLNTLRRLAKALKGRIRFSLEPREMSLPAWPMQWWNLVGSPLHSDGTWEFRGVVAQCDGQEAKVGGVWTTQVALPAANEERPAVAQLAQVSVTEGLS